MTYIAAIAKNRQVTYQLPTEEHPSKHSLSEIAQALAPQDFTPVQLHLEKPRTVWIALVSVHVPKLEGSRWIAIQLNAATWESATEVDYFLSNAPKQSVSAAWVAQTYQERNWVEVFYREAIMLVRFESIPSA